MSGLSQLERDLISQRPKEGLVSAKARGRNGGRPGRQNEKAEMVMALYDSGMKMKHKNTRCCRICDIFSIVILTEKIKFGKQIDILLLFNIIKCKESKEYRREITSMELAKVTSKGQITIPIAIRNALGIREGDKILFMQEGNRVILTNASTNALLKAQEAFQGVAEELGIKNEEDVMKLVKEIRAERGEQYKCESC